MIRRIQKIYLYIYYINYFYIVFLKYYENYIIKLNKKQYEENELYKRLDDYRYIQKNILVKKINCGRICL